MAISTPFAPAAFRISIQNMMQEWLVDALGAPASDGNVSVITSATIQDDDLEKLDVPTCEYRVNSRSGRSTGAGALDTEAVEKMVTVSIGFKTRSKNSEVMLDVLDDILSYYFQSNDATKGRKALGVAGLRHAVLTGPFDDNTTVYYNHRWVLTFRVIVEGPASV